MRQTFIVLFFLLSILKVKADSIDLIQARQCESILEMYVYEDHVKIILEVGKNDLNAFFPFLSSEQYADFNNSITESQLNHFLSKTLILEANEEKINGELFSLFKAPRTNRYALDIRKVDTLTTEISQEVILMELRYNINKPSTLAIIPPLKVNALSSNATIGFVTYHNDLAVNDLGYLLKKEKLILNWNDPWYSKFENSNLDRLHENSLMSYLYVEPFEVRHEVLFRIKDLDEWLDLGYHSGDKIQKEDWDMVLKEASRFLKTHNPVTIDGLEVLPLEEKARFVEVNLSGIQIIERPRDLEYTSAMVGVIFNYPTETIAQKVEVHWDIWSKKIEEIPYLIIDPSGVSTNSIETTEPVLDWTNQLEKYSPPSIDKTPLQNIGIRIPYISLLISLLLIFIISRDLKKGNRHWFLYFGMLVIGILTFKIQIELDFGLKKKRNLSNAASKMIVSSLLENTYKSFDLRDQEQVYDKLALSIDGSALVNIYLAHMKSMKINEAGETQAKVENLQIDSVSVGSSEDGIIPMHTLWTVSGTVGHWGHLHQRQNRYDAIIKVKPIDKFWKIVALDVIEESRVGAPN